MFSVVDPIGPQSSEGACPARSPSRLFKVVDVVSGRTIVDDASTNATVDVLAAVESIFDVLIYVWMPERKAWRQLTPGEHRILWEFRGR